MAEKKYTRIVVEENNEHGFDSYRVPGIVTASNGDLLLTYEGRKGGGNSRTLFLRRYRMIGETIEPIGERVTMVSPKDDELIHNPLLIAAAEGKLYFFWCQDYKRLFLKESDDNGVSFGTERELTSLIDGFRKEYIVGDCTWSWNKQKRWDTDTSIVAEPWGKCPSPSLFCMSIQSGSRKNMEMQQCSSGGKRGWRSHRKLRGRTE